MSGHGGSGPTVTRTLSCENLSESTRLNSPQQNVISKISIGDVLDLKVDGKTVKAYFKSNIAGTITWTNLARMIECIEEGHEYVPFYVEDMIRLYDQEMRFKQLPGLAFT